MRSLALLASLFLIIAPSAQAGELGAGKKVFNKCRGCHSVGPKVKKLPGPALNGVIGREWGAVEGYKYSAGKEGTLMAIHEAEPQTWDVETLSAYLKKPKDVVPKSKMAFPG
ncbi:MAG: c-type cytochrome, partial [Alphaproteobacteria bacterium]